MIIKEQRQYTSSNGMTFIFRSPVIDEYEAMADFFNVIVEEIPFVKIRPERLSGEKEKEKKLLEDTTSSESDFVMNAYDGERLIGSVSVYKVVKLDEKSYHGRIRGAVLNEYSNYGVGHELMKEALEEAKNVGYKQLDTSVSSDNEPAKRLFMGLGFKEVGVLQHAWQRNSEEIVDEIDMVIKL